jgi:hypothetical protein
VSLEEPPQFAFACFLGVTECAVARGGPGGTRACCGAANGLSTRRRSAPRSSLGSPEWIGRDRPQHRLARLDKADDADQWRQPIGCFLQAPAENASGVNSPTAGRCTTCQPPQPGGTTTPCFQAEGTARSVQREDLPRVARLGHGEELGLTPRLWCSLERVQIQNSWGLERETGLEPAAPCLEGRHLHFHRSQAAKSL